MRFKTLPCLCWHRIYDKEKKVYRTVMQDGCDICHGTGAAKYMLPTNPTNVKVGK